MPMVTMSNFDSTRGSSVLGTIDFSAFGYWRLTVKLSTSMTMYFCGAAFLPASVGVSGSTRMRMARMVVEFLGMRAPRALMVVSLSVAKASNEVMAMCVRRHHMATRTALAILALCAALVCASRSKPREPRHPVVTSTGVEFDIVQVLRGECDMCVINAHITVTRDAIGVIPIGPDCFVCIGDVKYWPWRLMGRDEGVEML